MVILRGGWGEGAKEAYGVAGGEFLFCGYDLAGSLSSIQSGIATDHGFSLGGAAFGLASDFGNGVPIVHDCGWESVC